MADQPPPPPASPAPTVNGPSPGLAPAIAANAAAPRTVTVDGTTATQHSLPDQIAADKYLRAAGALRRRPLGIRHVTLRPGNSADVTVGFRGTRDHHP